ncbi:unnamed protein product [Trichogramma brassicae]|uniref:Uncharacterized protein n=1 Tax=Trichogramma brassicae TaxID=86971 RepID=A0A6H5IPN8_9HYME|nr:unnamed protein product [Trichogramma brassicae]
MASQKKMDEQIFIDFECKNVKPELKSLKPTICKTEYQTCAPIVKVESPVQIRYSEEKIPMILIKKNCNYHDNCHFAVNPRLQIGKLSQKYHTHIARARMTNSVSYSLARPTDRGVKARIILNLTFEIKKKSKKKAPDRVEVRYYNSTGMMQSAAVVVVAVHQQQSAKAAAAATCATTTTTTATTTPGVYTVRYWPSAPQYSTCIEVHARVYRVCVRCCRKGSREKREFVGRTHENFHSDPREPGNRDHVRTLPARVQALEAHEEQHQRSGEDPERRDAVAGSCAARGPAQVDRRARPARVLRSEDDQVVSARADRLSQGLRRISRLRPGEEVGQEKDGGGGRGQREKSKAKPKEEDDASVASNFTKITITPEIHYDRKAFAASPPVVRCVVKADAATNDESTFESVDISEVKDKKPEVLTTTLDDKAAAAAVKQEKTTTTTTTTTQQSPTAVVQPRLIVSTPTTRGQNKKRKSDPIIAPACAERNNMSEKKEKPVSKALPRPLVDNNIFEKDEIILPAPLTNGISEKENKPIIEVSKSVLVVNKSKKDDQPVPTVLKSPIAKPNEKIDTEAVNKSSVIIDPSVQKDKMEVDVVPPRCKEFQHHNKSSQIRDSILVSTKNLQDNVAKVAKQISALRDADDKAKASKKHNGVAEKSSAAAAAIINKVFSDADHVFTDINKSLDGEKSIKDEKQVQAKLDVGLKVIRVASEESLRAESKLSPVKIKSPLATDFNNKIDEQPPFVSGAEKYADIVQANDIDGLTLLATISARHVKVKSELDSAAAEYLNEKMMIKLEADANNLKLHQQQEAAATYGGHEFKFDPASVDGSSNEHPNVILNGETVRLFQKSPNSNLYIINKAEMEEIKFNYQNTAQQLQLQQQIKTEFKPDPETAYLHGRDVALSAEKKQKSSGGGVVVSQTPPPPEPYEHHRYPAYLPPPPNPYCAFAHLRGAHRHDCHCVLFRPVPAYYVPPAAGAAATSNIVQSDMAVHESSSSGGKRKRDESQDQLEKVMGSAVEQMQKEQQQQQQQNKRPKVESRNNVRSSGSSSFSSCRLPIKKRYMAEHKLQEEEYNQHRRTPVPLAVESVSPRRLFSDCGSDSDFFNFAAAASSMMHEKMLLLDLGATVEVTSSTESPTTAAAAAPPSRGRGRPSGSGGSSSVPASRKRKSNANDNNVGVIVEKKAAKKTTVTNGNSSSYSNCNSSSSSSSSNSKKPPRASKRAVPVVNYTQLQSDEQQQASAASKRKRKKNTR